MLVTALIAFIYSLRNYSRHRGFRIIPYYIGFFLFQALLVDFYWYLSVQDRSALAIERLSSTAFTIFELLVFSLLILQYIIGPGRRLAIKLNVAVFFVVQTLFYLGVLPRILTLQMYLLEPLALVLPGVLYYYELITIVNPKALRDRPSFWIVSGILYLSVTSVTSMLTFEYIGRFGDAAFALGNIFYSILFVLWMRAYKCSPDEWMVAPDNRKMHNLGS